MNVVISKCSRNQFISEKYKTVQIIQATVTSASFLKGAGNKKLFSSAVAFSMTSVASQKLRSFNADFSRGNK
jgi:hypothetical protein